ncbi:MarR family transcriptional regulator [Arthrobacter sp. ATA002]|uniref:MarR family winged helix-turn-helix transcriptional regulator n=1 Tax=Arthrobacter sp. ATA002 TaxID=2991715 RepID=UPI0022A6E781|nr:MarR family transcriptional regulator [Arthrobacter sp. ATA002]WAP50475.1 MarR family transcriptional regulator [Arthrobacter sp. ATA002]
MTDGRDVQRERARVLKKLKALSDSYQASTLPLLLDSLLTTDLTIQQLKVLAVLATTEDGATGRGLADSFGVSLASMSGLIDRLVAQGAAARNRDGKDGRVRRVHATPLGRTLVRRLVADPPELSSALLARLPLEDLQALERGLTAVYAELGQRP